jgi:hypothetical protein
MLHCRHHRRRRHLMVGNMMVGALMEMLMGLIAPLEIQQMRQPSQTH